MDLVTLFTSPETWVALLTLTVLEIVLGIDNVIFISILVQRLPAHQRDQARYVGLGLAMGMRILLLLTISWIIGLTQPLFTIAGNEFSWRDVILIGGGLFLLWKATSEIHEALEGEEAHDSPTGGTASLRGVLVQIVLLDIVFSLDSVLTAVGMVDEVIIMIVAVVFAVGVMLFASGPLSKFVHDHPSVKILALSFLLLIGVTLDRGRVRPAHRQGLHLLGDGLQRLRRGAQPATAEQEAGRAAPDLPRQGRGRADGLTYPAIAPRRSAPTSGGTHRDACASA